MTTQDNGHKECNDDAPASPLRYNLSIEYRYLPVECTRENSCRKYLSHSVVRMHSIRDVNRLQVIVPFHEARFFESVVTRNSMRDYYFQESSITSLERFIKIQFLNITDCSFKSAREFYRLNIIIDSKKGNELLHGAYYTHLIGISN